ncbi:unnamed protein product [Sphagnum compactum]
MLPTASLNGRIYKKMAEQLIAELHAYRAEAAGLDPKYDGTWRDADPAARCRPQLDAGKEYTVRFRLRQGKKVVHRRPGAWSRDMGCRTRVL